jgi:hypothetical protein
MTRPHPLDIQFMEFLVRLDTDSWPARMEAACQIFERRFGISLQRTYTGTQKNMTARKLDDRSQFFRQCLRTKTRWFTLHSLERLPHPVPGAAGVSLDEWSFGGSIHGGAEFFTALCSMHPWTLFDETLLVELGDALGAHSAPYIPSHADTRLRFAHRCTVFNSGAVRQQIPDRTPEEAALPLICEAHYGGLAPLQPHHLGWINYWSPEVCDYVGFPQNLEGSPILQHCYRTPAGAWIVKLGPDPFEPRNATQLTLLKEIYDRFPRVAVRLPSGMPVREVSTPAADALRTP